ncbi:TIGR03016 family PEP-CTERM system-associated outer membrane protein [Thalassotalea agarivorans]|uniref:Uncharacterized protein, PEP-CTERM system associated n=1 Tax=Thalassotalea agarivorans TaxID=349064 RepID=A0A1I0DZM3_THASX|nr:TIGR03016 family PEP-CTERM system-associated outer membrane protein [Thalassotalea agarivorans]SET37333.1 uncharacterized protein, PEP-CTERM system associated [Thalassotalea agarivorans]
MGTAITNKYLLKIIIIISSVFSCSTLGQEWRFTPGVTLDETWTDNVELTRYNRTQSLVGQYGVTLQETYQSQDIEFNFNSHSIYATYSHDSDLNDDYHTGNVDGSILLWPQGIRLFGDASVSFQSRNQFRNALADLVSGDLVQRVSYSGGASYDIFNRHTETTLSAIYSNTEYEDDIGNSERVQVDLSTQNGSGARMLFWQVNGSFNTQQDGDRDGEYYVVEAKVGLITNIDLVPFVRYFDEDSKGNINNGLALGSQAAGAGLRWLVTPRWYIDASYNTPLNADDPQQDDFWDISTAWQPTRRTEMEASYSQRFYGKAYGLSIRHRNKRLTNSISYTEQIEAFTRDNYVVTASGFYWCPQDTVEPADCYLQEDETINPENYTLTQLNNYEPVVDYQYSLNRRLTATSELALRRTRITLTAQANDREALASGQEDVYGSISLSISRDLSEDTRIRLTGSANLQYLAYQTESETSNRYFRSELAYEKDLAEELNITIGANHLNRLSTDELYIYQENRIFFRLNKEF